MNSLITENIIVHHPVRVLLLLLTLIYATGLNGQFVNDDITYFIYNDLLPEFTVWQFSDIFLQPSNYWGELLPLRDYLYVVQFNIFGLEPFGYHLVSLGLYLLIVALIVPFLQAVSVATSTEASGRWLFIFVAAVFALHPVHVESVAYISGQKDLLCALFSLLCLILFFRMVDDDKQINAKIWFGFIVCYCSAFLSKNLAVATAMLLTICGFMLLRQRKRFWSRLVPLWGAINLPVIIWLNYSMSVSAVTKTMAGLVDISLLDRVVRAVRILGRHFMLAVWPEPLSFGYPFTPDAFFDVSFWVGLFGLVFLLVIFFFCRDFMLRFAVLLIILYLMPVSQLFYDFFNASIYDRYLFVPVLGVAILVGRGGALMLQHLPARSVHVCSVILLVVLTLQTLSYIPVYGSDLAVAERAFALYPEQSSSFFNYAGALVEAGELDEVEQLLAAANLNNQPAWVDGYLRGWIAFERGNLQRAIPLLRLAYWQCANGGYYPFPGVLLAKSMLATGDERTARLVIDQVMHAPIHNPVEYFKAKQLLTGLIRP